MEQTDPQTTNTSFNGSRSTGDTSLSIRPAGYGVCHCLSLSLTEITVIEITPDNDLYNSVLTTFRIQFHGQIARPRDSGK